MPAGRKKKTTTPEDVPDLGDPDRKRMLNVLAQRRYRQRRREKMAALEAQAKAASLPQTSPIQNSLSGTSLNENPITPDTEQDDGIELPPVSNAYGFQTLNLDALEAQANPATIPQAAPVQNAVRETTLNENPITPDTDQDEVIELPPVSNDYGFQPLNFDALDYQFFPENDLNNNSFGTYLSTTLPSSPRAFQPLSSSISLMSSSSFPFGGDPNLTVPWLSTMKAFTTIANLLNCLQCVFDPKYEHTLPPIPNPLLPPNLLPTTAQQTIPHHPLLDILPWPSVREKLICVFSLPSAVRPPVARDEEGGETGLMKMAYDLEDIPDGMRVHGNLTGWGAENEMAEDAWEIGGRFFRSWWWCLDSRVLEMTNRRRQERGLGRLRLEANITAE